MPIFNVSSMLKILDLCGRLPDVFSFEGATLDISVYFAFMNYGR